MGVLPVTYHTTADVVAKVKAELTLRGVGALVQLVGKFALNNHEDPFSGVVKIVPLDGLLNPPRVGAMGGNPRTTFTIARNLEIHVWAAAMPLDDASGQYAADLTTAEVLLSKVLRAFEIFIPGAKKGGRCNVTQAGEGSLGVVIVTTIGVELDQPDLTFATDADARFKPSTLMRFPDGSTDTGSDQF